MRNLKKITLKFDYGDLRVVRMVEKWGAKGRKMGYRVIEPT